MIGSSVAFLAAWPSGKRQVLKTPATNRYTAVQEP